MIGAIERAERYKVYEDAVECLADVLEERGLGESNIGIESHILPYPIFRKIEARLPKAKFVECSRIFERLRLIKSEKEVTMIKKATEITEKAIEAALEVAKEGVTHAELLKEYFATAIMKGAEPREIGLHAQIAAGDWSAESHISTANYPLEYRLRKGDIVMFEVGVTYNGYNADLCRTAVVGEPSNRVREIYAALLNAEKRVIESLGPGVNISEIYEVGVDAVREKFPTYDAKFLGHGLGLKVHEEPVIRSAVEDVLKPGMVINVEVPYNWRTSEGTGGMNIEDTFLITENGYEPISSLDRNLRVIL
jgi:Xaa-Pro aminopeptidase